MELARLGKMVPGILRKFKGETVADSRGWPFALINKSQEGRERIIEGEGEKSEGDLGD